MDEREIDAALAAAESELAAGRTPDLAATGFWRAVTAVKKRRELVDRYGQRIASIDRATLRRRVRLVFPAPVGIVLVIGGLFIDLAILGAAAGQAHPWREIVLLVGTAGLDIATHGLAHLIVGTLVGIRFTDWFVDLPRRPQPGFKIDYASYLRAPARGRAWMHASGTIVTKVTPFLVLPYALAIGADGWAIALIVGVGLLQLATDIIFWERRSDWKKFRREMRLARPAS
jgi:hypothetical protein